MVLHLCWSLTTSLLTPPPRIRALQLQNKTVMTHIVTNIVPGKQFSCPSTCGVVVYKRARMPSTSIVHQQVASWNINPSEKALLQKKTNMVVINNAVNEHSEAAGGTMSEPTDGPTLSKPLP